MYEINILNKIDCEKLGRYPDWSMYVYVQIEIIEITLHNIAMI